MPQDRYPSAIAPKDAEHITVYYDSDYFAGWPFNHGFKAFTNDELLVSFSRGRCHYSARHDLGHDVVDARGGEYVTLRSTDGGEPGPATGCGPWVRGRISSARFINSRRPARPNLAIGLRAISS